MPAGYTLGRSPPARRCGARAPSRRARRKLRLTSSLRSPTWNRIDADQHQHADDHQAVRRAADPRKGRAVMISASSNDATVPPMNVARPPARAAPPSTAAVMLLRVKSSRSGRCRSASGPSRRTRRRRRTRPTAAARAPGPSWFVIPPRFAARSSNPTARTLQTGAGAVQPHVEQAAARARRDEGDRDRPDAGPQERRRGRH